MIDLSRYGALDENAIEAPAYDTIVPGGYVCKIVSVKDVPDKNYLHIEYDIAEGKYADYYKKMNDNVGFWAGYVNRSYTEKSIPFFKRFCSSVRDSNEGDFFNPFDQRGVHDERILVGKKIGLALGEEEYKKNDGTIGTRMVVRYELAASKVANVKPPKKKLLKAESSDSIPDFMKTHGDADENPFN